MWQMDIKYYQTVMDGTMLVFSLMDIFDKWVVGTFIGRSVTGADVRRTIRKALEYHNLSGEGLMSRNDHG